MADGNPLDLSQFDDEALLLDGLDHCISLVTTDGAPVYSYEKLVSHFVDEDGMSEDDAIEWIDYNILGLAGNGKFHVARELF